MNLRIQEPIKNNYVIDVNGVGECIFPFTPSELEAIITLDITSNFDCITYFNSIIKCKTEEENTNLDLKIYFKTTCKSDEKESMLGVIKSYLTTTFLK